MAADREKARKLIMGEVILKDGSIVLTEPIVPSDDPSSIRAQYGFDRDYKCLKSNSILLISDIHFRTTHTSLILWIANLLILPVQEFG